MNPLVYIGILAGGYWYWSDRQKKKRKVKDREEELRGCDPASSRDGLRPICNAAGECIGLEKVEGSTTEPLSEFAMMLELEGIATQVFGSPKPWPPPTETQLREIANRFVLERYKCDISNAPDDFKVIDVPLGMFLLGVQVMLEGLNSTNMLGPREGLVALQALDGPCMSIRALNMTNARAYFKVQADEKMKTGAWMPNFGVASALAASTLTGLFPECAFPPDQGSWLFYLDEETSITWGDLVTQEFLPLITPTVG